MNRRKLARDFLEAARKGDLKRLDKPVLAARATLSRAISIRTPRAEP